MTYPVVGVDPGGTFTGIIARHGTRILYGATVTRDGPMTPYLTEVGATIMRAISAVHREQLQHGSPMVTPTVAVEDLNEPTPHLGLTNLKGLIGAAQVLGAVCFAHPGAVLVPPGRHGSAPLRTYPAALVGKREVVGTGKARHLRSAYDVAAAAVMQSVMPQRPGSATSR